MIDLYAIQQKESQNVGCGLLGYLFMITLNKHAPQKKDSSGQIIPPLWLKNLKQLWWDRDYNRI